MSRLALACCFALLLVDAAEAQYLRPTANRRAGVHRMDVFNGSNHTIRYFGSNLTPGETSTLRDLERLENELEFSRNVIALKQEYVSGERAMDAFRRSIQFQLYGQDITQTSYAAAVAGGGRYGYGSGYGYGYGSGYGFGNAGPVSGAFASSGQTTNLSLANGVGDEGAIKNAVARIIATQATPEYFATLERSYDRMALRAGSSDILRVALNLPAPEETRRERGRIRAIEGEVDGGSGPVTLTLKSGEKLVGKKMTEKGDWMLLEKVGGGQVRIRASEVTRIDEATSGNGVKGASD